jgi:hypothetical protein
LTSIVLLLQRAEEPERWPWYLWGCALLPEGRQPAV